MTELKKVLKTIRYHFRNLICSFFPMNNEIILESNPDLTCNSYELFQYMLSQNLNRRFRITWMVDQPEKYMQNSIPNVYYIPIKPKTYAGEIKKYIRCNRAKILITCNRYYQKQFTAKKQLNIYILHGSPVKNIRDRKESLNCDFLISQAEFFNNHIAEKFMVNPEQVVATGFPRNDQLFRINNNLEKIYSDIHSFGKVIAWVPTFRKHMNKTRVDCDYDFPLGIPVLYSEEDVKQFNDFLVRYSVLVIYKPHPVQDLSIIKNLHLSNIRFLYNDELKEHGVQTNEFLSQTDAMVGDYSGIYYDYLLLDRPIGLTLDDYSAFEAQSGMVFGLESNILIGEKIYTLKDLETFILHVVQGQDSLFEERVRVKKLTNKHLGPFSSADLYSFIMEEYEKRFKTRKSI